jgi:hypothetical protein
MSVNDFCISAKSISLGDMVTHYRIRKIVIGLILETLVNWRQNADGRAIERCRTSHAHGQIHVEQTWSLSGSTRRQPTGHAGTTKLVCYKPGYPGIRPVYNGVGGDPRREITGGTEGEASLGN